MLEINRVSKKYKDEEIYINVSLELGVEDGLTLLWGPSGSGKTTLINLIMGYEPVDSGEILVNGAPITNEISQDDISLIKQDFRLFSNLTVLENLQLIGGSEEVNINFLKKFKMIDHSQKKIRNLSGGQKQRVAIIRALLKQPQILICDEPTNGLDEANFSIFMEAIEMVKKEGTLVIIASHEQRLKDMSDTIVELKDKGVEKRKCNNLTSSENVVRTHNENQMRVSFNNFLLLIKNQQIEYFNKILLVTIMSMFFVFFSFVFFSNMDNYKKTFFNGMSEQTIIVRNSNVREPYGQDDKAGEIKTPPDRLYWGVDDIENVQGINGVKSVSVGEEKNYLVADLQGNSYTQTFKFSDYKKLFKSSIAINSAPENVTLSLVGDRYQMRYMITIKGGTQEV